MTSAVRNWLSTCCCLQLGEHDKMADGDARHFRELFGQMQVFEGEGGAIHAIGQRQHAVDALLGDQRHDQHAPAVTDFVAQPFPHSDVVKQQRALLRDRLDERRFAQRKAVGVQILLHLLRAGNQRGHQCLWRVDQRREHADDRVANHTACFPVIAKEGGALGAHAACGVVRELLDEGTKIEMVLERLAGFVHQAQDTVVGGLDALACAPQHVDLAAIRRQQEQEGDDDDYQTDMRNVNVRPLKMPDQLNQALHADNPQRS